MQWKFWDKSPVVLPKTVRDALGTQFRLESPTLDKLLLVQKSGTFAGRLVRLIRIYDPTLLGEGGAPAKRFEDFQEPGRRKAVLFDGHIEKEGSVILIDRRPPRNATSAGEVASGR